MDYLTARQTAEKWNISLRWVQALLKAGRIPGAVQPARDWLIPKDMQIPGRRRGCWRDNDADKPTKESAFNDR